LFAQLTRNSLYLLRVSTFIYILCTFCMLLINVSQEFIASPTINVTYLVGIFLTIDILEKFNC